MRAFGLLTLGGLLATTPPLSSILALAALLGLWVILVHPLAGVFLLSWSVPFQPLVTGAIGLFRVSLTEVLVLLYVGSTTVSLRRLRGLSAPRLLLPGLILLSTFMVSMLRARHVEASIEEIIKWAEFLAVYAVTVVVLQIGNWRRWMVASLLLAATTQAVVGIVQTLRTIGPTHFMANDLLMRAHGTFGQPNPFAGYLALFFPIAFALWLFGDLESRLPWVRPITGLVTFVLVGGLFASLSRGAMLGLASALLLMLFLGSQWSRRASLALVSSACVITLLAGLLAPDRVAVPALNATADAFNVSTVASTTVTPENWSILERLSQWHAGLGMFQDNVLIGIGIGNYDYYYPDYALSNWKVPLGHAHNLYLNIGAETGLLGLGAYVWLLIGIAGLGRDALRNQQDRTLRALALGILGSLIAYSTHSIFDMLFVQGFSVVLGLLIALLESTVSIPEKPRSESPLFTALSNKKAETHHRGSGAL